LDILIVTPKWRLPSRCTCFNTAIICVSLLSGWKFGDPGLKQELYRPKYTASILQTYHVKQQRNILHEISKRKANSIGHSLRRNCLLEQVIEGKIKGGIEVIGKRGRRRRKLPNDLEERRGYSHLKEEALYRAKWRARFGRGFGPVVRQTTKWMNEPRVTWTCVTAAS
jgi:hypothetical protein